MLDLVFIKLFLRVAINLSFIIAVANCFELIHRIAFGSCNKVEYVDIWEPIANSHPQSLVLLGDTIYADKRMANGKFEFSSLESMSKSYDSITNLESFKKLLLAVNGWDNIMATYDDHDYGNEFS